MVCRAALLDRFDESCPAYRTPTRTIAEQNGQPDPEQLDLQRGRLTADYVYVHNNRTNQLLPYKPPEHVPAISVRPPSYHE